MLSDVPAVKPPIRPEVDPRAGDGRPGLDQSRRARALRTKRRILEAARSEFLANGYHGATIASVARRSGVAPQTIYFIFHTKTELIRGVIEAGVLGPDEQNPIATDWWRAMEQAESGADVLATFVRNVVPLYSDAAGVSEVLRAAAATDDELRVLWQEQDAMQSAAYRRVIDIAAAKGKLRKGLSRARATDLLLTAFGDSAYVLLKQVRGWSDEEIVRWMSTSLPRLLLHD